MKNIHNGLQIVRIIARGLTHRFFVLLLMSGACGGVAIACPTCIGVIEHNSPKFFSNDAYQAIQENHSDNGHLSTITQEEEK